MSASDAAHQLRCFVERVERLDEEAKEIRDDRKDVFAEAKANGFDTATIRKVIARRRLTPDQRDEADSLLATYESALGMDGIIDGGVIEGGQLALPPPETVLPKNKDARRVNAWLEGGAL